MFSAATRVHTTVEAEVIRADGRREQLGVIGDTERKLTLRERLRRPRRRPR